jgi:3-oxoadipate enol-lactonase
MPQFVRDNVTIHYELDGTGIPAVYISGFGDHSNRVLGNLLRHALSQQYQVLSVDNRGSGQTIVGDGASVTLEAMADDIAAIMDQHGITSAHVLGNSMGGCIAMLLALRHPAKVRSLIIAVSFAYSERPSRGEFLLRTGRMMREHNIPLEHINRYNATLLLSDDVFRHEAFIQLWLNGPLDPLFQSNTGFYQQLDALETYDIRDQLERITVPTLVMSSPDDILVPPYLQDEIANGIPHSEMKLYPGGHIFMLLPWCSGQFLQDVLDFWGRHTDK